MNLRTAQMAISELISRTPGIRGGRPRVAGAGVTVRRIAACHQIGMEPEEILAQYPHLKLTQVHAALAYYYGHRQQIDADLAQEQSEYDRLARTHRPKARTTA